MAASGTPRQHSRASSLPNRCLTVAAGIVQDLPNSHWGVERRMGDESEINALRAVAHPLRLRMLSLLTGTARCR